MFTVQDLLHTLKPQAPASAFAGKHIHIVGIGGCGTSGLAAMLVDLGAYVSGTDSKRTAVTEKLAAGGATIRYEAEGASVPLPTEILVYSAAVKPDHPEMIEAGQRGIAVYKYAQMLGKVMSLKHGIAIAGTHGKSTTTALTAHVLLASGRDPSFVVGATCKQLGGSARSGGSELFVAEACEFDRSFHNLHPKIGVVLNIDEDHLEYYKGGLPEIIEAFGVFMNQVDPAGVILTSATDPSCEIAARNAEARVETYGVDVAADWQATGVRRFNGKAHFTVRYKGKEVGRLALQIAGRHNVGNALVAAAIATHVGVPWKQIAAAVESFTGADRRSQQLALIDGVRYMDDYGHHPTEIRATLLALREHYRPERLICVFQPHQHARTRFLLEEFARSFQHADLTIVPDIYFVRDSEADRKAVNSGMLVDRIRANGREAMYLPSFPEIIDFLSDDKRPGDLIVSMGAGPVWEVTYELVRRVR